MAFESEGFNVDVPQYCVCVSVWAFLVRIDLLDVLRLVFQSRRFRICVSKWAFSCGRFKLAVSIWAFQIGRFKVGVSKWAFRKAPPPMMERGWKIRFLERLLWHISDCQSSHVWFDFEFFEISIYEMRPLLHRSKPWNTSIQWQEHFINVKRTSLRTYLGENIQH